MSISILNNMYKISLDGLTIIGLTFATTRTGVPLKPF